MQKKDLPTILICDDDATIHLTLKKPLKTEFKFLSAYHGDEALAILKNRAVDLILLDMNMRSENEGLDYIPQFKELDQDIPIIINSGNTDFSTVKEALKKGAGDYLAKNLSPDEVSHILHKALEKQALVQRKNQNDFELKSTQKKHSLLGESLRIVQLKKTLSRLQTSPANIFITGETGCGKEVFARQLRGTLPDGTLAPFASIDSATIQNTMAESILFGHEKGAFTGADTQRKGIFEESNGGIVYFDEIGNMPLEIQSKLLRVLQEKEICRLGSTRVIPLEFRVVSATNQDLEELAEKGLFKYDLLQRLNVIPVHIPPLRDRREDIPLLLDHFIQKHTGTANSFKFTADAIHHLQQYSWPGNIRELSNVVAYLVTMTDSHEIEISDLPPKLRDAAERNSQKRTPMSPSNKSSFYEQVSQFESEVLSAEYKNHQGNISKMALDLGMDRSHLYSKLKNYQIHQSKK
jgi:DNA-binding NtrC family response regulator